MPPAIHSQARLRRLKPKDVDAVGSLWCRLPSLFPLQNNHGRWINKLHVHPGKPCKAQIDGVWMLSIAYCNTFTKVCNYLC